MDKQTPENNPHTDDTRIPWHPAFYEAIQLELEPYKDTLRFEFEHQLTAEPLKMDILIIKKEKDVVIDKNIASIFRKDNIVEYKSPEDYIAVEDFYKVYGYACLYASFNKVAVTDLTITFVETKHPRDLIQHLKETRGYRVEERWDGIYLVSGDSIPIQIIETKKLSAGENIWLKELSNDLDAEGIHKILTESSQKGKAAHIKAYLQAILQANSSKIQEALGMSEMAMTLDQVLEETGLTVKWEARGVARGEARGERNKALEIIKRALGKGMTVDDIADLTGYDSAEIEGYKKARLGD
jgi:hypothetical protein